MPPHSYHIPTKIHGLLPSQLLYAFLDPTIKTISEIQSTPYSPMASFHLTLSSLLGELQAPRSLPTLPH